MLAAHPVKQLAKELKVETGEMELAWALIAAQNPKPALAFSGANAGYLIPDVLVVKRVAECEGVMQKTWQAEINTAILPKVMVRTAYAQALNEAMKQHQERARIFVHGLSQRFETLLMVAQAICRHQQDYFQFGPAYLKPLLQKEVAQQLKVHPSTIARAVNNKYMATPWGIKEMKTLFSASLDWAEESITGDPPQAISNKAVQARIAELIKQESKAQPWSDEKIAVHLLAEGISCARRTVAHYRENLGILPARLRKIK